jgi:nitrogenase subunit NifH
MRPEGFAKTIERLAFVGIGIAQFDTVEFAFELLGNLSGYADKRGSAVSFRQVVDLFCAGKPLPGEYQFMEIDFIQQSGHVMALRADKMCKAATGFSVDISGISGTSGTIHHFSGALALETRAA